jgi:hypothetical protein
LGHPQYNSLFEVSGFIRPVQVVANLRYTELGLGPGVENLNLWQLNYGYAEDLGGEV